MKLVHYRTENRRSYGILMRDGVACLPSLAKLWNEDMPNSLEKFISAGSKALEAAEKIAERVKRKDIEDSAFHILNPVLLAPLISPPKIICLGLNYRDHVEEQYATMPEEPIIFLKPRTTIVGPYENIVKPDFVRQLDYEAELAIVIGRRVKNVSLSDATSCVFGYTILNDVSARDIQFKDKQWTRGKSLDTFAPVGPCITTENQMKETSDLLIRTWVNDELRQDSTTARMIFKVPEIIHHLSRVMTLEPCDIVATGTPAGVGFAQKPEPKFLRADDVIRIEIEKIGILENKVIEEASV